MKRRDFLKILGGVAAFSCADREAARRLAEEQGSISDADLSWQKAPCRYCGTGCGVEVGVRDGRVMAVRGDQASPVNRGLLCVKGYHLPAMLYGEDRLLYPMKRNGEGFERISWDQALDLVAAKYREALDQHGPESVSIYGSGQWPVFDGYAASKWFRGACGRTKSSPTPASAWPRR